MHFCWLPSWFPSLFVALNPSFVSNDNIVNLSAFLDINWRIVDLQIQRSYASVSSEAINTFNKTRTEIKCLCELTVHMVQRFQIYKQWHYFATAGALRTTYSRKDVGCVPIRNKGTPSQHLITCEVHRISWCNPKMTCMRFPRDVETSYCWKKWQALHLGAPSCTSGVLQVSFPSASETVDLTWRVSAYQSSQRTLEIVGATSVTLVLCSGGRRIDWINSANQSRPQMSS